MRKVRTLVLGVLALAPMGLSGCFALSGIWPFSMGFFTPIPVPPWVTERLEEKYCWKNDFRTPIMPPIREGFPPPLCEDPPDEARILRAMPPVKRGIPYICEEFRDNIQIVTERIVDKIDPPRFFPLIGPAQLHHCHWKCTIYYVETIESGYPFPFRCVTPRVQVVYIDLDHLHLYPCPTPDVQRDITRDVLNQ
ncbi:MAG TPA: hypothetical protein VH682_18120 [Gemmataceae bacterium]